MADYTIVTRGSQITLTKDVRERAGIKEGDRVSVNIEGSTILISKKNPKIFDEIEGFLPENFNSILKKIRSDEKERLKRLGVLG